MQRRASQARVDDVRRQRAVAQARKDIFQRGITTDSKTLNDHIKDSSVPVDVRQLVSHDYPER